MNVLHSNSTSVDTSNGRWWILPLLVCMIVFAAAQFQLSRSKRFAEKKLAEVSARLEAHQTLMTYEKELQDQISITRAALGTDQSGLNRAFGSFKRREMVARLKSQFVQFPIESVVVAKNRSKSVSNNHQGSHFIYSPDSTQELVVYVKVFDDSSNQYKSERYSQTAMEPDQVFRFPLTGNTITEFACSMKKTKSGRQLFVEVEGQRPKTIMFPHFRVRGSSRSSTRHRCLSDPNVFQFGQNGFRKMWHELGVWQLIHRGSFNLKHKTNGTDKRVYLTVGLKSDRSFRISGDDEYKVGKFLDLEWDSSQGNYKATPKPDTAQLSPSIPIPAKNASE